MPELNICPKCSNLLRPDAKFCTKCGNLVRGGDLEEALAAPEGKKKKNQKPVKKAPTIKRDFWRPDAFMPEGVAAPLRARAAAFFIDSAIFMIIADFFLWVAVIYPQVEEMKGFISMGGQGEISSLLNRGIVFVICCLVYLLLYGVLPVSVKGMTLGKYLAGIKVVPKDGELLTLIPVITRYLAYLLSGIPLFIGFLWAIKDEEHETWHDKLSKTTVVHAMNSGTLKSMFLYASPVIFAIVLAGAIFHASTFIDTLRFTGPVETPSPKSASKVYCDSGKNPMNMYYLMPTKFRSGKAGLTIFLSIYKDIKAGNNVGSRVPAGSVCKVEKMRPAGKDGMWVTFNVRTGSGPNAKEISPSELFVREKDGWFLQSDAYQSLFR